MFRFLITPIVLVLVIVLALFSGISPVLANSVVIPDIVTTANAQNVEIPIMLTNFQSMRGVVVPLTIESTGGGASITSARMEYRDRLYAGGPLDEIRFCNQYAQEDGSCKDGGPGGYGTIINGGCGVDFPVAAMPEGFLMVTQNIFSTNLPAGSDVLGSMVLIVDIGPNEGTMTVDTTCANPANHLILVTYMGVPATGLTFTMGTITVGSDTGCCGQYTDGYSGNTNCSDDGKRNLADITLLIDRVYISKDPLCCEDEGNTNGDPVGKVNLADITLLIDHVYISKEETSACE